MKVPRKATRLRTVISAVGMGLAGMAVFQELRKPPAERTWHGHLWHRVPYEFRPPTMARLRQAYWAPEDSHVFTNTPFGVGWSINVGRLIRACAGSCGAGHRHTASAA